MVMNTEIKQVEGCLKNLFESATDIFVDTQSKECEVKISVDDYLGEFDNTLIDNKVKLKMVDFCDTYPFKYVFSYNTIK